MNGHELDHLVGHLHSEDRGIPVFRIRQKCRRFDARRAEVVALRQEPSEVFVVADVFRQPRGERSHSLLPPARHPALGRAS